ncbi:MAG: glycosyltransferase family 2 protein [Candidatus Dojkabacteria bacterium]|nr:glycosyltransferase family 2 protein [Candidatus Dojkabacteria bacterium]MDD4561392.1 glycosyltransferase family 2 protein [Candidatus Dojkabacteria bacterium]
MDSLIIIVNYNGKELLEKSLPSVVKYTNADICVVDNNSTDDSLSFLKNNYPSIKLIESEENLGYGNAHNLALETHPNYNYYVFMNNDITVTSNWLEEMIKVFNTKEGVGAVGPKILLSEKKDEKYLINSAGMDINKHLMAYDRYEGEYDDEKYNTVEKVDGICGAVMLLSKEVIEKVKGFNPKMFLYYEDVDLSLRIRDLGYDIYYCGNSVVYHNHMASTKDMGSFKRNRMNMVNRYTSIKDRVGSVMALKETMWYLCSWIVWKLVHSKNITLKEYINDK